VSDTPKMTDGEIAFLIIERDTSEYKKERIDELLNKIGAAKGFSDAKKPSSTVTENSPGSTDLDALPWKSYKTKEAAGPEEPAWIFRNTKGVEALEAQIKNKGKVQIGKFEYSFSGPEKQFISRKPLKEG